MDEINLFLPKLLLVVVFMTTKEARLEHDFINQKETSLSHPRKGDVSNVEITKYLERTVFPPIVNAVSLPPQKEASTIPRAPVLGSILLSPLLLPVSPELLALFV